ncbi:hypothetical protein K466DRAFT_561548 [Polyporus arcularius HHB13444]|uniref:HNH nuclease domain-containing protein n=1 Tax=Polyporus arcularius HHB13444 TaxID=1314778 RepID=A0A5C3PVV3_9APHY|nr:hypothetical protein K466DRAFT_561548 [Polyporus arcularius HHB13444]
MANVPHRQILQSVKKEAVESILDACEVLTRKKGKLASDREGRELVLSDLINGAGRYYYIVEDDYQIDYPVFRSIHEWVPPSREEVPDRWFTKLYPRLRPSANDYNEIVPPWFVLNEVSSESAIVAEVKEMDKRCLLSAHGAPLEAAHVFPAADVTATWYNTRDVTSQLYEAQPLPLRLRSSNLKIHDVRNLITLRTDICRRWDEHAFMFIPVDGCYIAYYIAHLPEDQAREFHCTQLNTPDRADGYLFYIRFALTIFFTNASGPEDFAAYPEASEALKLPTTGEESEAPKSTGGGPSESGQGGGPVGDHRTVSADALKQENLDEEPVVLTDEASLARYLIACYEESENEYLPADLEALWDKYIPRSTEPDTKRLRDDWEEQQKRLRESGHYSTPHSAD